MRLQNQHWMLWRALTIGGRFRRLRRTATDICEPLQTAPGSILAPRPNEVTILSSLQPGCTCIFIKSYQYCNILYFINVVRLCQNFTQNVSFFGPEDEIFARDAVRRSTSPASFQRRFRPRRGPQWAWGPPRNKMGALYFRRNFRPPDRRS